MRSSMIVLLLLFGCHATTELAPPEPPEDARSMLLFAVADGYQAAFAVDLPTDGSAPSYPIFSRPAEIDLYSVNFTCPLDVLGIEEGRQMILDEPTQRLELPSPSQVLTSHDGAQQTAWQETELTPIDELIRSVELPEDNLCRLYGVQLAPLELTFLAGTSTPTAVVALENGKALVANADGTYWEVDADRNIRRFDRVPPGSPNGAGFAAGDGTVWMVGDDGTIAHGDPNEGIEIIETEGSTIAALAIVDGAKVGPTEIYRAGFRRVWERFDGTRWTRLSDGVDQLSVDFGNYSVAWVGVGEAIGTGVIEQTRSAIRYRDGVLTELPMPEDEVPTGVAHLPGIGSIIGTRSGRIIRERDGQWVIEDGPRINSQVRNIVPTRRGFFYGRFRWASWDPVAGFCRVEAGDGDGSRIVPLGDDGFLLLGGLFGGRSFLFTFVREEIDHPCLGK